MLIVNSRNSSPAELALEMTVKVAGGTTATVRDAFMKSSSNTAELIHSRVNSTAYKMTQTPYNALSAVWANGNDRVWPLYSTGTQLRNIVSAPIVSSALTTNYITDQGNAPVFFNGPDGYMFSGGYQCINPGEGQAHVYRQGPGLSPVFNGTSGLSAGQIDAWLNPTTHALNYRVGSGAWGSTARINSCRLRDGTNAYIVVTHVGAATGANTRVYLSTGAPAFSGADPTGGGVASIYANFSMALQTIAPVVSSTPQTDLTNLTLDLVDNCYAELPTFFYTARFNTSSNPPAFFLLAITPNPVASGIPRLLSFLYQRSGTNQTFATPIGLSWNSHIGRWMVTTIWNNASQTWTSNMTAYKVILPSPALEEVQFILRNNVPPFPSTTAGSFNASQVMTNPGIASPNDPAFGALFIFRHLTSTFSAQSITGTF